MSVEAVSASLSILFRNHPAAELGTDDNICQWWTANVAGHRRLLEAAGFRVLRGIGPFSEPFGRGHPAARRPAWRGLRGAAARRVLGRADGVPHAALLAEPAMGLGAL